VLGVGTAVFEDLAAYMESLEVMLALKPSTLFCGHGPEIKDGVGAIEGYISHRMKRITQVARVLEGVAKPGALSADDVTRKVYDGLAEHLIPAATGNTASIDLGVLLVALSCHYNAKSGCKQYI
jgi:glyoxylase-like metal-dependent hydrolase (beta-lactamase superfamily II)